MLGHFSERRVPASDGKPSFQEQFADIVDWSCGNVPIDPFTDMR